MKKTKNEFEGFNRGDYAVSVFEQALQWVLPVFGAGIILNGIRAFQHGGMVAMISQAAIFSIGLLLLFFRRTMRSSMVLSLYCLLILAYGVIGLVHWGLIGQGLLIIIVGVFVASMLGRRHWIMYALISVVCTAFVGWGHMSGLLHPPENTASLMRSSPVWILACLSFFVAAYPALMWDLMMRALERNALALQHNETRYRTFFDASGDAMLILRGGTIVDCNAAALKLFSCHSMEELIGRRPGCLRSSRPAARIQELSRKS